tara:strand:- start:60 stop:683 length:624 start_codon:yes stop_codon:yes gene_type:complete
MGNPSGYLYLIKDNSTGLHKIGVTKNWGTRSRQLRVGKTTTEIKVLRCINFAKWEKVLHKLFDSERLPGSEWFKINTQDAIRKMEWIAAKASNMVIGKWRIGNNGAYRRRLSKNGFWYTQKSGGYTKAQQQEIIDSRINQYAVNASTNPVQAEIFPERYEIKTYWNKTVIWLGLILFVVSGWNFPVLFVSLFALFVTKKDEVIKKEI